MKRFNSIIIGLMSIFLTLNFIRINQDNFFTFETILVVIGLTIGIYFILKFVFNKVVDTAFEPTKNKITKKQWITYILIIIIPLIVGIIAYYPGYTSPDSITQYSQASGNYPWGDWHPLFHTLIFFKFPTLIHEGIISCTIFQCIFILCSMLIFCQFCRKYFLNHKLTIITLLLFVLNPTFIKMSVTLWKDIPYSYCLMFGTMILIALVKTEGKWIETLKNKILFIITCFGMVFFRHNGIICFVVMIVLLIILYKNNRKFYTIFGIIFLISKFIITGPIYNYFEIRPNGGIPEMLGVPMNQLSYIYNNGGELDEDQLEIMNNITPLEIWKEKYSIGEFNSIKWATKNDKGFDATYISNNTKDVLGLWKDLVIKYPTKAIRSYLEVTKCLWKIDRSTEFIDIETSSKEDPNNVYRALVAYNNAIGDSFLRIFTIDIGEAIFYILIAVLVIMNKYKTNLKAYLPFLLVLCNFGVIMLLITGGETRFVYGSILCSYPLIIYALGKNTSKQQEKINSDSGIMQFIKYFGVGAIAAIVNIGMLYVFTDILQIHYIISNILSFTLGLITNYILSKKWVFKNENIKNKKIEFIIYALIGVLGLALDTFLLYIIVDKKGLHYILGKIISTIIVFVWNFIARKVFYKLFEGKM